MRSAGLDVGGANIKAACLDGTAFSRPFALWEEPRRLTDELRNVIARLRPFDLLAVTMTGELCDCFESRAAGVRHILESVVAASTLAAPGSALRVWQLDGRLAIPEKAVEEPLLVAAANWLALATWAAQRMEGDALLIDIGSTTTDIVVLQSGSARPLGLTDLDRLQTGELVYNGVVRTPVCALVNEVSIRERPCRVAAEVFATTLDVYLLLGELEEDPHQRATADGREATRAQARNRLARMVCADPETVSDEDARQLAEQVKRAQLSSLRRAAAQVVAATGARPRSAFLSGAGEFLARELSRGFGISHVVSCAEIAGRAASEAACAYALAELAAKP